MGPGAPDMAFADDLLAQPRPERVRDVPLPETGNGFPSPDDWRDANEGYRREYGDREFYRHEFREGFRAGYTDAFNAYARDRR